MDYSTRDSSIWGTSDAFSAYDRRDTGMYVGIVREEKQVKDESTRYVVEIMKEGRQVAISCILLTRWGGAHNFEEFRVRPWQKLAPGGLLPPTTAGTYSFRSGDTVLVAFINGQSREGVIIGGLRHPARVADKIPKDYMGYLSSFNGLETQIRNDGSYKVTFQGLPLNDKLLDVPGVTVQAPKYNPLITGSYFGFSKNGSFVASDGSQYIKIDKNKISGAIIIVSGKNRIELGGNPALGTTGIVTDTLINESKFMSVSSTVDYNLKTLQYSIKAMKMAIGNDGFELFKDLGQLIDALGTLIVTSPVGTCTPLMAAPTWASLVVPIKLRLALVTGSLKDPKSFSSGGDDDPDLGDDIS